MLNQTEKIDTEKSMVTKISINWGLDSTTILSVWIMDQVCTILVKYSYIEKHFISKV